MALANLSKHVTPSGPNSAPASAFTKSYTSGNLSLSAAQLHTLTHGLGEKPKAVQLVLKCTSAEGNYSVGDELVINNNVSSFAAAAGTVIVPSATTITVRIAAGSPVYSTLNKTTGAAFTPTLANWVLIVKAWA